MGDRKWRIVANYRIEIAQLSIPPLEMGVQHRQLSINTYSLRKIWLKDIRKKSADAKDSLLKAANETCDRRSAQIDKDKRRQYNTEWKRHARTQSEFREYERQRTKPSRKDPAYRDNERESNRKILQRARKEVAYRDKE